MTAFDLQWHGRRFAAEYPPHGHSDHLPMTWLALAGLGADRSVQEAFAAAYLPRLEPLPAASPAAARIAELTGRIRRDGTAAVLGELLPRYVTGWHREAYHPLLRLAYGVEFGVAEEVAAGLAYLEQAGASDRLAELAAAARPDPERSAGDLFRAARSAHVPIPAGRDFTTQTEAALADAALAALAVTIGDDLHAFSVAALGAFAATHDFFALHLVTASHAFRVVAPWTGAHGTAVFNLGLLAGYLAIGAPPFAAVGTPRGPIPTRQQLLEAATDFSRDDPEHRIKLAYACWQHAGQWREPAFLTAAQDYLARH